VRKRASLWQKEPEPQTCWGLGRGEWEKISNKGQHKIGRRRKREKPLGKEPSSSGTSAAARLHKEGTGN